MNFQPDRVGKVLIWSQRSCFNECILSLVYFVYSLAYIVPVISIANSYQHVEARNSLSQIFHFSSLTILEAPAFSFACIGSLGVSFHFCSPFIWLFSRSSVFCQYSWSYIELIWRWAKIMIFIHSFTHSFLHLKIEKMVTKYKLQNCIFNGVYPQ